MQKQDRYEVDTNRHIPTAGEGLLCGQASAPQSKLHAQSFTRSALGSYIGFNEASASKRSPAISIS